MRSRDLIIPIFVFLLSASCQNQNKSAKRENDNQKNVDPDYIFREIGMDKFDSVSFYKNVILSSYKGLNKLDSDTLSFPFTAFCFRGDTTEIKIFLSEDRIMTRYIRPYKTYRYTQIRTYSPETRDSVYETTLFVNDTISIDLRGGKSNFIGDETTFNAFNLNIMTSSGKLRSLWYSYQYSEEAYSLNDVLTDIVNGSLKFDFANMTEDVFELKGGDMYRSFTFSNYKNIGQKNLDSATYLLNKNITGGSFFYFYLETRFKSRPL